MVRVLLPKDRRLSQCSRMTAPVMPWSNSARELEKSLWTRLRQTIVHAMLRLDMPDAFRLAFLELIKARESPSCDHLAHELWFAGTQKWMSNYKPNGSTAFSFLDALVAAERGWSDPGLLAALAGESSQYQEVAEVSNMRIKLLKVRWRWRDVILALDLFVSCFLMKAANRWQECINYCVAVQRTDEGLFVPNTASR